MIAGEANRWGADLIIVGSRGRTGLRSMLLGSVSAELLSAVTVPLLIARTPRANRIILAWDGSEAAAQAASCVRSWPIFHTAQIRALSVADVRIPWQPRIHDGDASESVEVYLDALSAGRTKHAQLAAEMAVTLQANGRLAEPECREGNAAVEILVAARGWPADLIVLGFDGHRALPAGLGSVARNVALHAPCSVLVVPRGAA